MTMTNVATEKVQMKEGKQDIVIGLLPAHHFSVSQAIQAKKTENFNFQTERANNPRIQEMYDSNLSQEGFVGRVLHISLLLCALLL